MSKTNWPGPSQSIHGQRTRTIVKPGSFDNRDLKMRSSWMEGAKRFIEAWESCNSVEEVRKALGIESKNTIRSRAWEMRKRGIPLKKYPRHPGQDFDALREFHKSIQR